MGSAAAPALSASVGPAGLTRDRPLPRSVAVTVALPWHRPRRAAAVEAASASLEGPGPWQPRRPRAAAAVPSSAPCCLLGTACSSSTSAERGRFLTESGGDASASLSSRMLMGPLAAGWADGWAARCPAPAGSEDLMSRLGGAASLGGLPLPLPDMLPALSPRSPALSAVIRGPWSVGWAATACVPELWRAKLLAGPSTEVSGTKMPI
jgi:hypothetical protein